MVGQRCYDHGLTGSGGFASVLALECFSPGTRAFQCWHLSVSVLALECVSAGTLTREVRAI